MPGAGDIRAGRAFIEMFVDQNPLTRGLSQTLAKLKAFGAATSALGKQIFLGGAAVAAPLLSSARAFATSGSELLGASAKTGLAVENLSALAFAAKMTGTDLDSVVKAFGVLSKTVAHSASGSREATQALEDLGTSVEELSTKPNAALMKIAEGLGKIENPMKRLAVARAALGKGGADLIPFLTNAPEFIAKAKELGIVMSAEDAQAALALSRSFTTLTAVLSATANKIGAAVSPVLMEVFDAMLKASRGAMEWVQNNKALFATILKVSGAVAGAGAAIWAFGKATSVLAMIAKFMIPGLSPLSTTTLLFKSLPALIGIAKAAFAGLVFVFSPFGSAVAIAAASVALLGTVLLRAYGNGSLWDGLVKVFENLKLVVANVGAYFWSYFGPAWAGAKDAAVTAWGGIVDSIASGDLTGAMQITLKAAGIIWQEFFSALKAMASDWKDYFLQVMNSAFSTVMRKMTIMGTAMDIARNIPGGQRFLDLIKPEGGFPDENADKAEQDDMVGKNLDRQAQREADTAGLRRELARMKRELENLVNGAALDRMVKEELARQAAEAVKPDAELPGIPSEGQHREGAFGGIAAQMLEGGGNNPLVDLTKQLVLGNGAQTDLLKGILAATGKGLL